MYLKSFHFILIFLLPLYGCSLDKYFGNVDNSTEQVDATYFNTRVGAVALANGVLGEFYRSLNITSLNVGLFTDELQVYGGANLTFAELDSRTPKIEADGYQHTVGAGAIGGLHMLYGTIHRIHLQATLARQYLRRLNDPTLNNLISLMYVVEGYAILGLAENFCSGVPLSQISPDNVATYGSSLSKDALLKISISLFDSMMVFEPGNEDIMRLASLGKARSLLNIGDLEAARSASEGIPIDYSYSVKFTERLAPLDPVLNQSSQYLGFWTRAGISQGADEKLSTQIVAREGNWGLDWYVDPEMSDPRLPVSTIMDQNGKLHFTTPVRQQVYPTGEVTFHLATGIDAQLIESEYRLSKDQPDWIEPINNARSLVGLQDTVSPLSYSDKISLLFRERAFWNYLKGVRLSDLRRLNNQYNIPAGRLFPSGTYVSAFPNLQFYRDVYVFIPGPSERELNNNYKSCNSFDL